MPYLRRWRAGCPPPWARRVWARCPPRPPSVGPCTQSPPPRRNYKGLSYEDEGHTALLPRHGGLGLIVPLAPSRGPLPPTPAEIIKALPTKMKGTLPSSLGTEGLGSLSPSILTLTTPDLSTISWMNRPFFPMTLPTKLLGTWNVNCMMFFKIYNSSCSRKFWQIKIGWYDVFFLIILHQNSFINLNQTNHGSNREIDTKDQ